MPQILTDNPTSLHHRIVTPPRQGEERLIIHLSLKGGMTYFPTRKPTLQESELAKKEVRSYDLNYDNPEWDPQVETYQNQEMVAQERLGMDDTRLSSFMSQSILNSI